MDGCEDLVNSVSRASACESCQHIFNEKDKIIKDLNLKIESREHHIKSLEGTTNDLQEQIVNLIKEKEAKDVETNVCHLQNNISTLEDHLKHLENEKRCLNEKVCDFEHEVAGLSRMFGMQQEKFQYEMKNRERIIKAGEEKRQCLEKELEACKQQLQNKIKEDTDRKEDFENLQLSIRKKDLEISNLIQLHEDAKKLVKTLKEEVFVSNEAAIEEKNKNKLLENKMENYATNIEILRKENTSLRMEIDKFRNKNWRMNEEKTQMEEQLKKLTSDVETLKIELNEKQNRCIEVETYNTKLNEQKIEKEEKVQKLEEEIEEFRKEIENLKMKVVLLSDEKQALESKISVTKTKLRDVVEERETLEKEIIELREYSKNSKLQLEKETSKEKRLEEEVQSLRRIVHDLNIQNKEHFDRLKISEETLDGETKEKEKLQDEVKRMEEVIEKLNYKSKKNDECFEETKKELEEVSGTKEHLLINLRKLEDENNKLLLKISTLSDEIQSMHDMLEKKDKLMEELRQTVNEKSSIVLCHESKVEELQNCINEVEGLREMSLNELNKTRKEIHQLREENKLINANYKDTTIHYQDCQHELRKKEELLIKVKEDYENQTEELSQFKELNMELNNSLRGCNDEISLLVVEKNELQREVEIKKCSLENSLGIQSSLKQENESLKMLLETLKENESASFHKLAELKKKLEIVSKKLDEKTDKNNDLEIQLNSAFGKAERWKKMSLEIKEERNKMKVQLADFDKDLNDKKSKIAEKMSCLEKENEVLQGVIKRLKSNDAILRANVEELRNEVDKLSVDNSEKESEVEKLSIEKERIGKSLRKLGNVLEENTRLEKDNSEIMSENFQLRKDNSALQDKVSSVEQEFEQLRKEMKSLQDNYDVSQGLLNESTRECKKWKKEYVVCQESVAELTEEKERLARENIRLKEKANKLFQEKSNLEDIIESLETSQTSENETLCRKNALLENELASRQCALKKIEENELKLYRDLEEMKGNVEKTANENDQIKASLKKAMGENTRLRKKADDLNTKIQQMEKEKNMAIDLQTELTGKDKILRKYKENINQLNESISLLTNQQNDLKDKLQKKEIKINDLNTVLEKERIDATVQYDKIMILENEIQMLKQKELKYTDELHNEKENRKEADTSYVKVVKERDDLADALKITKDTLTKNIGVLKNENQDLANDVLNANENIEKMNRFCENLENRIAQLEDENKFLEEIKHQLDENVKKKFDEINNLTVEINTLKDENIRLQEHAENVDKILTLQNPVALNQVIKNDIKVLYDTLSEPQSSGELKSIEIKELRRKLSNVNEIKLNAEMSLIDSRQEQERLQSQNLRLQDNYTRLQNLVKQEVALKMEKEETEKLLKNEKQKNHCLQEEVDSKSRKVMEKENEIENLKQRISECKETIEQFKSLKEELLASVEKLTRLKEEGLVEVKTLSEKNEKLLSEKNSLIDLVSFHNEEIEKVKNDKNGVISELKSKTQEKDSEINQLKDEIKGKNEDNCRLNKAQIDLQESLQKIKEEINDLENENEDLLFELDELKGANQKAKDVLCSVQGENSAFQDELKDKEKSWNEEKELFSMNLCEIRSKSVKLNDQLTLANERNLKLRELEKVLRLEIDELSDGYIKMEEKIHHRNRENQILKEKIQILSQEIEDVQLARDTACLLKEKRNYELLKCEGIIQRLEKELSDKQKSNNILHKEIDSLIEKEKYLELQILSEKDLSNQRLNEMRDLQNSRNEKAEKLLKAEINFGKMASDVDTLHTSNNSMKIKIETLEDELIRVNKDEQHFSQLYQESKLTSQWFELHIAQLKSNFSSKVGEFQNTICTLNHERCDLNGKYNDLKMQLDDKSKKVVSLEEGIDAINLKYEQSLLEISLLQNDVSKKDEQLVNLHVKKERITSSLKDLDLKIAEIQGQAEKLENDNSCLRNELANSTLLVQSLNESLKNKELAYVKDCDRFEKKIKKLKLVIETFAKMAANEKYKIKKKYIKSFETFQKAYDNLVVDNSHLVEIKKHLERELSSTQSHKEELKKNNNIEKTKQLACIEELVKECKELKEKLTNVCDDTRKNEKKLEKANISYQEMAVLLENQKGETLKYREQLNYWEDKVNKLKKCFSNSTLQSKKLLLIKDEELRFLANTKMKLENKIKALKSKTKKLTAENNRKVLKNKIFEKEIELKDSYIHDLEVYNENSLNLKNSLEIQKHDLLVKVGSISRELKAAKKAMEVHVNSKKEMDRVLKEKEEEHEEDRHNFEKVKETLNLEIYNQLTSIKDFMVASELDLKSLKSESFDLQKKFNAHKILYDELNNKYDELQDEYSVLLLSRDKALCKVTELAESLLNAEANMETWKTSQVEEDLKISQELQKMQRELTVACERFRASCFEVSCLKETIIRKDKYIAEFEKSMKDSAYRDRFHQIKIKELEAKNEVIENLNKQYEMDKNENNRKIEELMQDLKRQELTMEKEITRKKCIQTEKAKLNQQLEHSNKYFSEATNVIQELKQKLGDLKILYQEKFRIKNCKIENDETKVKELHQRNDLNRINEYITVNLENVEEEKKEFLVILSHIKQEKEAVNNALRKLFAVNFRSDSSSDEELTTLEIFEKIIECNKHLWEREEFLLKEKEDRLLHIVESKKENTNINKLYQNECMETQMLREKNGNLTVVAGKLQNELHEMNSEMEKFQAEIFELKMNLESVRHGRDEHQYQCELLQREKENLEDDVNSIEDEIEELTSKLNESVNYINGYHVELTEDIVDDSGVASEDNVDDYAEGSEKNLFQMTPDDELIDSGIFVTGPPTSLKLPSISSTKDETTCNKKMHNLHIVVDKSFETFSKLCSSLGVRLKTCSIKEKQLVKEMSVLKKTSLENEELLGSLEQEIVSLESSQKSLQQFFYEKENDLNDCLKKLDQSNKEREIALNILEEILQKLNKKENILNEELPQTINGDQLERLYLSEIIEHRNNHDDVIQKQKMSKLCMKLSELDKQIDCIELENQMIKNYCLGLEETIKQLNRQEKQSKSTLNIRRAQIEDLQKQKKNDSKRIGSLSGNILKCENTIHMLKTSCIEKQELLLEIDERFMESKDHVNKALCELSQLKENDVRARLEIGFLTDQQAALKEQMKNDKVNIKQMSMQLSEKDEKLRKNEAQLKLVNELLVEMSNCKDCLEIDFSEVKKNNSALTKDVEELKNENKCLNESLNLKDNEVSQMNKVNKQLNTTNEKMRTNIEQHCHLLFEATKEKENITSEAKVVYTLVEELKSIVDPNSPSKHFQFSSKEGINTCNLIRAIHRNMKDLTLAYHKLLEERDCYKKKVVMQDSKLEDTKQLRSTMDMERKTLDDEISTLCKIMAKTRFLSKNNEASLNGTVVASESQMFDNLSLFEKTNFLMDNVMFLFSETDGARITIGQLKESIQEMDEKISELKSENERIDEVMLKLRQSEEIIKKLRSTIVETTAQKEEVEKKLEITTKKTSDLEKALQEQVTLLKFTSDILAEERERNVTLSKLAKTKEYDLENMLINIKSKDDRIEQLNIQVNELKSKYSLKQEELVKIHDQLEEIQNERNALSNEKIKLHEDCSVMKTKAKELEKDKEISDKQCEKENKKVLFLLENIKDLKNEVNNEQRNREQLEKEMSEIIDDEKEKIETLELKIKELQSKFEFDMNTCDSALQKLKSELSLSESLRSELEERITNYEKQLSDTRDKNANVQREIQVQNETIEKFTKQEQDFINEKATLQQSVIYLSNETTRLEACYQETLDMFEIKKESLVQKQQEIFHLKKTILSCKQIAKTIGNSTTNFKSELQDLKCDMVINMKKIENEVKRKNDELQLKLRDMIDTKVNCKNTSVLNKLQQGEVIIQKLRHEVHMLSSELRQKNKKIFSVTEDLEKTKRKSNEVYDALQKICTTGKEMIANFHENSHCIKQENGNDVYFTLSSHSFEIHDSSGSKSVDNSLLALDKTLREMGSSLRCCLSCNESFRNDLEILTVENKALCEVSVGQNKEIENLAKDQARLIEENTKLREENDGLKNWKDCRTKEFENLKKELKNERKVVEEITTKLLSLKNENTQLLITMKGIKTELHEVKKVNIELEPKKVSLQQEMHDICEKQKSLIERCELLSEEKSKVEKIRDKHEKVIVELENERTELLASCEELERVKQRNKILHKETSTLEEQKNLSKHESEELKIKYGVMMLKFDATKEELETLNQRFNALNEENEKIQKSSELYKIENVKFVEKLALLEKEVEAKNKEMKHLKENFAKLDEEKKEMDEVALKKEVRLSVLETDLKSSIEYSNLLQKRVAEESDKSSALQLKKEILESKVCNLQNKLGAFNSTIEDLRSYLKAKDGAIDDAKQALKEKTRVNAQLIENFAKLKNTLDDCLIIKKKSEEKLERAGELLRQEKALTNNLTKGKKCSEQDLQCKITKLNERMNYLTCELATSTTRETLYKQKIGSMEVTLDKIENESTINVVANNDNNERKTRLLNDMKIVEETPMNAESKLNETTLEKEKLFNANHKMSTVVKELKNTIASINNDDKKKFEIIDDLKCQLDVAKEVKRYLENQIQIMEKMREWSKTLKKSHSSNKTLSFKISQLNNDISKIEEEKNLHNDRNSLQQKNEARDLEFEARDLEFEARDLEFESKNNEIRTLEARVDELQNKKNQLNICVKYEKDQLLVLNIQFQELEKIKVSLEEKMRKQQNQLGNTLLELSSAKATIKELESVKEELNSKISLLVEEKEIFQKSNDDMKMEIRKVKNELSDKVLEHSSLLQEYNATKNEKNVAVALLKKNKSELCFIKQNACDLITKKKTLEVEITNFKVIFEQLEFVHQEVRTANVQLQESNKRLERELEKLKNGSHAN